MRSRFVTSVLTLLLVVVLQSVLFAQGDAALFDYQVNAKAQTDSGAPVLILQAREFIERGEVRMQRDGGKEEVIRLGKMKPGQQKRIAFNQPKGTYKWKITVTGESQFKQTMESAFETEVSWVDPIRLSVDPQKVEVGSGKLYLNSNVPLQSVDIEVFDNSGNKFVETTQTVAGQSGDVLVTWSPARGEVGAIRLKATDTAGFWNAVVLEPFWVEIPHREVIFDFGKATWQAEETPKLDETLKGVQDAMQKHEKKGLQMQLYIVGYTDTVGGHADNNQLSTARAKAIAAWFRKAGIKLPIYYQGFGESVLAVQTPDNTPEPRNRRALYILGNAPPPTSGQIPRGNWKRL